MARVLYITAGTPQATTVNTTQYFPLGAGACLDSPSGTESLRTILFRSPGKLSKLYVRVIANTITGTSTLSVRNTAADTAMTVNITGMTPGVYEDTINEVTVAPGDKLSYKFVPGDTTNSLTISILAVVFEADVNTITRIVAGGLGSSFVDDSAARYHLLTGTVLPSLSAAGTESTHKTRIRKACTAKNLAFNVTANTRTTDTTIRMRKNGANGNMSIVLNATITGWREDNTNNDTLAAGDDYNSVIETLAGGNSCTIRSIACDLESTTSQGYLINAATAGLAQTANTTNYFAIAGALVAGTTEADRKVKAGDDFTLSELTIFVSANTVTATSTLTLRKNGVNTALTLNIGASSGATVVSDSTHTVTVTSTDELSLILTTGATGTSMTIRHISINSLGRDTHFTKTLSETQSIGETRARQKAVERLQP